MIDSLKMRDYNHNMLIREKESSNYDTWADPPEHSLGLEPEPQVTSTNWK